MKKFLTIAILFFSLAANAQNAKLDKNGNYVALHAAKDTSAAKNTGKTFTDAKGIVYVVYVSRNGKLFVIRTSKAGNTYRMYLKV